MAIPSTHFRQSGELPKEKRTGRLVALVIVAAGFLGALIYLSLNVTRDLRLLNSASSDNVQWTLSQVEVEFLEFQVLLVADSGMEGPDLTVLRRRYDIFFSRITTLEHSPVYRGLQSEAEFSRNLALVRGFLDRTVTLIDAGDAVLRAGLPDLRREARDVRIAVRALANAALYQLASESDRRRETVAVTLTELAIGVTILLLALLALAAYLGHLNDQNIRRRRQVTEAARRMDVVTSTALDAVIVIDASGIVLDFNAAAEQTFGYPASEALGRALGDLIVPDAYRAAHDAGMRRMHEGGERRVVGKGLVQMQARRRSGETFPVEIAIQAAETAQGEIFVAFLRDISYRVRAEQDLVEARDRALRGEKAKTDFLATMSHEIRTPLNGLLGNLALLRDTRLDPRQARYIRNMETSGKLLMSHISDVLDITKYDAGQLRLWPVAMDISALMQDIIDNQGGAAQAQGTRLNWGWTGPRLDWILADRDRIQHILMNIIGNAVKFTRNGRVSVTIEQQEGPALQITVSDTGIGIDEALQARIFDDFVTGDSSYDRESGGTGLGLGIARRFVHALGGSISVHSRKGEGSRFVVRWPVEPIPPPDLAPAERTQAQPVVPCRILLVEDNAINREVARDMLVGAGHLVTEAHNGREAFERAMAERFDLILMDISMPLMDGREATRAIREGTGASAHAPIIALTANAVAAEQQAFLSDGMNDILTKPLNRSVLERVLVRYSGAPPRPTPVADPGGCSINHLHLAELRATVGPEALSGLLDRLANEVADLASVRFAAERSDLDRIAGMAHRVAGSAATFGAAGLHALLVRMEGAAKAREPARLRAELALLPDIWRDSRRAIELAVR